MARNNALNFNLPSVDDLFSTEESRAEARLEKVVNLNPSEISDFPDHPFKVRMDAAMQEMAESVKQYGVLVPALVRPKQGGGYEMVAGHRRKMAAELAQLPEIPCIVRNLTDDEATIIMVDSNLQREQILPSEKGFAYKMKLDAMKRQGQRVDLTSDPLGQKLKGVYSVEVVAQGTSDSKTQVQRYIRLTHLIPDILELVDNSVLREPEVLQIAMRPAVELSYLRKEEQADLFAIMEEMDCTPWATERMMLRRWPISPSSSKIQHRGRKSVRCCNPSSTKQTRKKKSQQMLRYVWSRLTSCPSPSPKIRPFWSRRKN